MLRDGLQDKHLLGLQDSHPAAIVRQLLIMQACRQPASALMKWSSTPNPSPIHCNMSHNSHRYTAARVTGMKELLGKGDMWPGGIQQRGNVSSSQALLQAFPAQQQVRGEGVCRPLCVPHAPPPEPAAAPLPPPVLTHGLLIAGTALGLLSPQTYNFQLNVRLLM